VYYIFWYRLFQQYSTSLRRNPFIGIPIWNFDCRTGKYSTRVRRQWSWATKFCWVQKYV